MRMNNSKKKKKQLIQQETKDTVSHNGEQFKEQTRRLIREESYELKQREARECNIIISNMSEEQASDEEDGSSDTDTVVQRATDHEKVTEMIHKILKLENVEIMEVKRLSKPDDDEKPRLVWVTLGSRIQRNQVMKCKTKLKSSRWSNVFMTTDMTKKTRGTKNIHSGKKSRKDGKKEKEYKYKQGK